MNSSSFSFDFSFTFQVSLQSKQNKASFSSENNPKINSTEGKPSTRK
jgi:hypothetical protein